MTEVASQTLQAAAREVATALTEARTALEVFVEQPRDKTPLERCATELHQVRGALRLLEIHGGALLAEEMEQVARYLAGVDSAQRNQSETLDALMRSLVQLPSYLERVHAGGRDMTLVLLPLLNDLRAVRGNSLLSEGTILLLNLKSDRQASPTSLPSGQPNLSVAQWSRRLRTQFQTGLIGWIRNEAQEQQLDLLGKVAARMEQVATQQCVFQLWWVVGALIEGLRENGIEGSVAVKRLLGLADRELKSVYEQGESRYSQSPPVELLNNLLYYIARASSFGPRIKAVRASFRLDELLPVDEEVEHERDNLSAPSVKLMHTVAAAIREDLARIKDVLDIFVRRGGHQVDELRPQTEMLRKLADTLGVLGLGELRTQIQEANGLLGAVIDGRKTAGLGELVQVAAMLIKVDDHLDDQLVGLILPRKSSGDDSSVEIDRDFLHVQAALLRECGINLARIKESISQNVNGNLDAAGIDGWPELVRGVKAGLLMLGRTRAAELLDGVTVHLRRVMQPGGTNLSGDFLDRLADSIVSIEYYIETLQAGRKDPWYMLDNAQRCLEVLAHAPVLSIPTVPVSAQEASYTKTIKLTPPLETATAAADQTGSHLLPQPPVLPAANGSAHIRTMPVADPDLMRLFAEEAREEAARIRQFFPLWDQDPLNTTVLETVRRSFHTLKGSGRMVGARALSEFAWSFENLLNRILDGTLSRSPAIVETMRAGVAQLPALVQALEQGKPAADTSALVSRAHALAASNTPLTETQYVADANLTSTVKAPVLPLQAFQSPGEILGQVSRGLSGESARETAPGLPTPAPDQQLNDIYARETATHVATVREWLSKERACPAPHVLAEVVFRACHTMYGSSRMAEVRHGVRLAEPMNHWLRISFDSGVGLDDSDLALLGDCMGAMEVVAGHLNENTGYFAVHETLRARIARAEIDLERRVGETAAKLSDSGIRLVTPSALNEASLGPDFDPEVAAIFCEEAVELLDSAQAALQAWNQGIDDAGSVTALQRPLHTLKGGARMAGIVAMGDLSHELETLVIQIENGLAERGARAREVVQQGVDELARMRESALVNRGIAPADALIAQIKAVGIPSVVLPGSSAVAVQPALPPPEIPLPAPVVLAPVLQFDAEPETPAEPLQPESTLIPEATITPEMAESPQSSLPIAAAPVPPGREPVVTQERGEMARVSAELLDRMLNSAGEVSISRARLEQQLGAVEFNLGELTRTVTRLKEQLRKLELETEAQILHKHGDEPGHRAEFDPLELDRYSSIQQFSRALAESTNDVASLQQLLGSLVTEALGQLQLQARVVTELQNGLMNTRMVPFKRHVQRLLRVVRQAAQETGKQADLVIEGGTGELDRQVLDRILPPLEHMLRNAVAHGIEAPPARLAVGKPAAGQIQLTLRRESAEVIIEVRDDGAGMNLDAIRTKGVALGLIKPEQRLSDDDLMQLVLEPGFSTADSLSQQAGRGIGMDVVATEIKKLGGALHMQTARGQGTQFVIKLPFTLATSHALIVRTGDEVYALPLPTIEGVVRLARDEVAAHLRSDGNTLNHEGQRYRVQPLSLFVGLESAELPEQDTTVPLVLVRAGEQSTALVADEVIGSREIVVKTVGPQLSAIRGISGATVLSDGRVVLILDIGALVRAGRRGQVVTPVARERVDQRVCVLVVDDSITVRRVTQRLLERNGMRVLTARDGMDALALLQDNKPDIMLLDIEMPRMDGYEVAAQVRGDAKHHAMPIIMITSRVGEKHRARAIELGVNDYLGKPYLESQLLEAISPLVAARRAVKVG
jgi:chemosensory pili system protein ChpA (sensor histidine kinase/response regulator)